MTNCNCEFAIFELPSVHKAFQGREKKRGSFLCSSDMLIAISFEIEFLLENVRFISEVVRGSRSSTPPPPKKNNHNLEVKAFIQRFCCLIWEMRHWKTPPNLNCVIQISLRDANFRTHGPKYCHWNDGNLNDHSNCAFCSRVKTR